jgi:hypothetical protein
MTAIKPIDDSLFVQMWEAGAASLAIGAAVGLGRSAIYPRAALNLIGSLTAAMQVSDVMPATNQGETGK